MLYSCTHIATVGIKGLTVLYERIRYLFSPTQKDCCRTRIKEDDGSEAAKFSSVHHQFSHLVNKFGENSIKYQPEAELVSVATVNVETAGQYNTVGGRSRLVCKRRY